MKSHAMGSRSSARRRFFLKKMPAARTSAPTSLFGLEATDQSAGQWIGTHRRCARRVRAKDGEHQHALGVVPGKPTFYFAQSLWQFHLTGMLQCDIITL